MKTLYIRNISFICAFCLLFVVKATFATTIEFTGQLGFVEEDNGAGVYSGAPLLVQFFLG